MQTENGAVSLDTTGDPRVNLFFKTVRFEKTKKSKETKKIKQSKKYNNYSDLEESDDSDNSQPKKNYNHIFTLIDNSWKIYPLDTLKILYNWRDCRGGKGDRSGFFESIQYLYSKYPEWILQNLKVLPEYGRFLDLIELYHLIDDEKLEKEILNIFIHQIDEDFQNHEKGLPISLAAKWIPRENGKWDRKNGTKRFYLNFCKEYRNKKNVSPYDLKYIRKEVLGPLKKHINLVETLIAEKRYSEIKYETVPSIAMKKYRNLFIKYDRSRFTTFLVKLQKGETKINAQQLYPHDIISSYKLNTAEIDIVLEEQWKVIKNKVNETKAFDNSLCVVDVSGSMEGVPINVAMALGLLSINETNNNSVITFHSEPELVNFKEENTLLEQVKKIKSMPWGMNTNIEGVFDIIFGMCIGGKNIDKLFIFSDMQFDQATTQYSGGCYGSDVVKQNFNTHYIRIKNKFNKAGLNLPTIIFWNLRANTHDFPVKCDENNVILLSGYSPSLLTTIVNGEEINPLNIILSIINSERYNLIVPPLE